MDGQLLLFISIFCLIVVVLFIYLFGDVLGCTFYNRMAATRISPQERHITEGRIYSMPVPQAASPQFIPTFTLPYPVNSPPLGFERITNRLDINREPNFINRTPYSYNGEIDIMPQPRPVSVVSQIYDAPYHREQRSIPDEEIDIMPRLRPESVVSQVDYIPYERDRRSVSSRSPDSETGETHHLRSSPASYEELASDSSSSTHRRFGRSVS